MTNQPRHLPKDGGVTLLELILIIVIVGIISALAIPTFNYLDQSRTKLAGRQLAMDITYSRDYAQSTGVRTWTSFNSINQSWTVLAEDPANPGRANATVLTNPATGQSYIQTVDQGEYTGVQMTAINIDGGSEVGFDWLGRPVNETGAALASQGQITLNNNHQVVVEPGTGYIQMASP